MLLALFALNFDVIKDLGKNLWSVDRAIPRSTKFKYIRDIAICKQNMATSRVKNIRSRAAHE